MHSLPYDLHISTLHAEVGVEIKQVWLMMAIAQDLCIKHLSTYTITTMSGPGLEHESESPLREFEALSSRKAMALRMRLSHTAC